MKLPNGYGSIIKLKGKRRKPYQVRVTNGWTEDGKQEYAYLGYFAKKEEALNALSEYNLSPYDIKRETITFAEVYGRWSKGHFEKVSNSSIERYENAYRKYCKTLYNMRFKDIRLVHLQGVIDESGMAHPTRASIKTLFNVLFNYAIKNDIAEKNYAQYVDVGKREGEAKKKPFTVDEINKVFANVDKMDYMDTILIMIYTGLRIQELLDIKIENVHLDERYMIGGGKTKAGTDRIIPISRKIEPYIKRYYEKNKDREYLIINLLGRHFTYSNYRREKWDNMMEKLQMEHLPHECRHTFATLMDNANANKLCIKRIMGHAAPDITDSIYTHKNLEQLIEAVDLI